MYHFPRCSSPTSTQSLLRSSVSFSCTTHQFYHWDDRNCPWWCLWIGIRGLEGGGSWGTLKYSCCWGGWIFPEGVFEGAPTLGNASRFFKRIHFWCYFILSILHLPVLGNHVALSLHWYSNINPCWGLRVHYDGFYLPTFLGNSYYSPVPRFHFSFLDFLKGQHSPMTNSVIICFPQK